MKTILTVLGIVVFLAVVWIALPLFDRRDPDYEAKFVGALDFVEREIVRREAEGTVLGLYAPSFKVQEIKGQWMLDGTIAKQDSAGEVSYSAFVALLRELCRDPDDPACWEVEKLEIAATRNPSEEGEIVAAETVPSAEGPKLAVDPPTEAELRDVPPIQRTPDDRVESAPLAQANSTSDRGQAGAAESLLTSATDAVSDEQAAPVEPADTAPGARQQAARSGGPALSLDGQTQVLLIQTRLTALGYQPGPIDGQQGPRTASAIEAYQRDHGLAVDGKPSQSLLNHLGQEVKGN